MTVTSLTSLPAGTKNRTRLVPALELLSSILGQKLTLIELVNLCDGLEVPIVTTQGQPNHAVRALSWTGSVKTDDLPAGTFPGRFKGTEALTRDGLVSLVNYLSATGPEAA